MLIREYVMDSQYKLVHAGGKYVLYKKGAGSFSDEYALREAQKWLDEFKVRLPGYYEQRQREFNEFIGK